MTQKNPRNLGELGIGIQEIIKRLLKNQNLCKLLYYTDKDPLGNKDIENTSALYGSLIDIIPKLPPEETPHSFVVPVIVSGIVSKNNSEIRDFLIKVYVYVPPDQWKIKDSNLRPFAILGEIQKSLDDKYIMGFGTCKSGDMNLNLLTDSMTCYTLEFYLVNYD